ncbi:hypothetical protein [Pseudonocardia sp. DLS-67]
MLPVVNMVYSSAVPGKKTRSGAQKPEVVGYAANSGWQRHEEEPS